MAAATCMPPPNNSVYIASFDQSTLYVINCSANLNNFKSSTIEDLPTVAVLTSNPGLLSGNEVTIATETLANYLKQAQDQVPLFSHWFGLGLV